MTTRAGHRAGRPARRPAGSSPEPLARRIAKAASALRGVRLEPPDPADAPRPARKPGGQPGHKVNPRSIANLKRGGGQPKVVGPTLTPAHALDYVKLRAAGVPALDAVLHFRRGDEHLQAAGWRKIAAQWEADDLVKAAWDALFGAAWQDLPPERRLEVAYDVHLAQCAYVLYTSDLGGAIVDMRKIEYAKSVIVARLAGGESDDSAGKFNDFLRGLLTTARGPATPPPSSFPGIEIFEGPPTRES